MPNHTTKPRRLVAMTLIEVIVALTILAISMGGIFAAMMQSRRLTEGSVVQNSATTIVQGYVEQMKNMELAQLINGGDPTKVDAAGNPTMGATNYLIPTRLDDLTLDVLKTSTGTPPALSTLTAGTTPTGIGIADNLKSFDVAKDSSATSGGSVDTSGTSTTIQTTWTSMWPGAVTYSNAMSNGIVSANTGKTDLHLNLWTWVTDLTGTTTNATRIYGITIIYTWQYLDGDRRKYVIGTVRAMRSSVPTM